MSDERESPSKNSVVDQLASGVFITDEYDGTKYVYLLTSSNMKYRYGYRIVSVRIGMKNKSCLFRYRVVQ